MLVTDTPASRSSIARACQVRQMSRPMMAAQASMTKAAASSAVDERL